ncbi:alpha/beta fold hydrolase [Bifidobacterium aquikefiricola]|uniref:Alpha/beta hydrolase n=1 Tax=Bifidobacterium aquikefiricola TaxID=3059038 RepID=A0AB39U6Y3_9BIFI
MYVEERGSGTALLLIHGFGVDHRILSNLSPMLDELGGWRQIFIDLPGHGKTPIGDIQGSQGVVNAVEDWIRDYMGGKPFAVIGNSFGGMVARCIAHDMRDQVLGLATVAGVFVNAHERRTLPGTTVLHEDRELIESLGETGEDYAQMAVVQTADHAAAFKKYVMPGIELADRNALHAISAQYSLEQEPEDQHPEAFTKPSLFITGRQDQVVGYRDAWHRIEHYPRASFAVLDAAGHNVHLEQQTLTEALVKNWLERITAERQ